MMKNDKKFDCVKYMREARKKISNKFSKMSSEEILKYLRDKYPEIIKDEEVSR